MNFRTHTAVVSPETEHHKVIDGFDPSDRQKTHQILAAIGVKKQTLVWRDGLSLDTSTKKEKLLASCLLANSWVILHSSTFSDDILIFLQTRRTLNLPFTEVGSQDMKVGNNIFLHLELEMNPLPYHSSTVCTWKKWLRIVLACKWGAYKGGIIFKSKINPRFKP